MNYDCNLCIHLNITEKQQTDKKLNHRCMKHNVRVFHRNHHINHNVAPIIYPCKQCNGKHFIFRKEGINGVT